MAIDFMVLPRKTSHRQCYKHARKVQPLSMEPCQTSNQKWTRDEQACFKLSGLK